ncbi:hypothetical protein [Photobacterium damselae]|uniref:hypothetical protein n=1 Tax=Photobacterium damselae TaxID=38293 RepID=UPI001F1E4EE8|nr:hypothetical protein [Photobacterium damselae]UKA04972.1 hypothetical protein IHC89_22260 [Photobacterium damselae subsp. damselae]
MSKYYEVNVTVHSVVLVKVEDYESETDALEYATDEFSNVGGVVSAAVKSELTSENDIDTSKRHSDLILLG